MQKLITFQGDNDSEILVEVEPVPGEMVDVSLAGAVKKMKDTLTSALAGALVNTCLSFVDTINKVDKEKRPQEMTVDFGVKVAGEGQVVVVKTSGEANFNVSLKWNL